MMARRWFTLVSLCLVLAGVEARADDTTEAYARGLSDLEGYFIQEENRDFEYVWLLGYGVTDRLSLSLGYSTAHGERLLVPAYFAELFATVWEGPAELDLMAGGQLTAASDEEGGETNSYWLGAELSTPLSWLTPYARLSYEWTDEGKGADTYLLTAGALLPLTEGMEFIASHDWFWSRDAVGEHTRSWSLGVNTMLTDDFELLVEYRESLEAGSQDWASSLSIGFILTMEELGRATAWRKGGLSRGKHQSPAAPERSRHYQQEVQR